MTCLFSDERLPKVGELSSNLQNFDRDRLLLFDEKKVFDTIIQEGQFPLFSNSYMLLLGPRLDVQYVKYSNDRKAEFRIKTVQRADAQEKTGKIIEKHPLSKEAWKHIEHTAEVYRKLTERYMGGGLAVNRCRLERTGADNSPLLRLEYVEGRRLEELLDDCLERNDIDGFQRLFGEYLERISYGKEVEISNYDLIFANLIIPEDAEDKNNKWNVIDYEWSFEKDIDIKEIAFRAVYCYLLENEKRNKLNLDLVMKKLDVTQADAEQYRRQEMAFQQYVTGKYLSMGQIREAIGNPVYTVEDFLRGQEKADDRDRIQIYEDTGRGFREEQSFFLDDAAEEQVYVTPEGMTELSVVIAGGRSALRIDPCSDFCMVYLKELKWNGTGLSVKGRQVQVNGFKAGENTYVFPTRDPNITVLLSGLPGGERNLLQVVMAVTRLPEETAKHMQKRGLF